MSFLAWPQFCTAAVLMVGGLLCVASGASCPAAVSGVTGAFNAAMDYFPYKVNASEAGGWRIDYYKSFKILTAGGEAYVLTINGAPRPSAATVSSLLPAGVSVTKHFTVPVARVALTETVSNAVAEQLGVLGTAATRYVSSYSISACAQRLLANEPADNADAVDLSVIASNVDVVFGSSCGTWVSNGGTWSFAPCAAAVDSKFVQFKNTYEASFLAAADWLGFFSAFFNLECNAVDAHTAVQARYACTKSFVAAHKGAASPKVAFVQHASSNSFFTVAGGKWAQLVSDVGGTVLAATPAGSFASPAAFKSMLASAGVTAVIVRDSVVPVSAAAYGFSSAAADGFTTYGPDGVEAALSGFVSSDEFEGALVEPDLLLQQVAAALFPALAANLATPAAANYQWLHPAAGAPSLVTASQCSSVGSARTSHAHDCQFI